MVMVVMGAFVRTRQADFAAQSAEVLGHFAVARHCTGCQ